MVKSVIITKFLKTNKIIINPLLKVKDNPSFAIEPYDVSYWQSSSEIWDRVLYVLQFSREGAVPNTPPKERLKEFLDGMGVKTMKALHTDSIQMDIYLRNNVFHFTPWINKGPKNGFQGFEEDMTIKLPFDASREKLVEALELTLSRCK